MRKFLGLVMACAMTFSLVACSSTNNEEVVKKGVQLFFQSPNETVLNEYDAAFEEIKDEEDATLSDAVIDSNKAYADFSEYYDEAGITYIIAKTDYVNYQDTVRNNDKEISVADDDITITEVDESNYDVVVSVDGNEYKGRVQIKDGKITCVRFLTFSAADFA